MRRDLSDGTKREVVKDYLLEHPERVQEDTQEDIASDLGVSPALVSESKTELEQEGVKQFTPESLSTDEKRDLVRSYHEDKRPQLRYVLTSTAYLQPVVSGPIRRRDTIPATLDTQTPRRNAETDTKRQYCCLSRVPSGV